MPLPPAPTKRAALLSPDALDAPARAPLKPSRKTVRAEPAQKTSALDLLDSLTARGGDSPVLHAEKKTARALPMRGDSYQNESVPTVKPASGLRWRTMGSPFVPELVDQTLDVATAAVLENLEQLAHGRSIGARSL